MPLFPKTCMHAIFQFMYLVWLERPWRGKMANQSLLHLQIVFEAIYENSYKTASIAITKLHWQNGECPEGKSEMSCTAGAEIQVNPPPHVYLGLPQIMITLCGDSFTNLTAC